MSVCFSQTDLVAQVLLLPVADYSCSLSEDVEEIMW